MGRRTIEVTQLRNCGKAGEYSHKAKIGTKMTISNFLRLSQKSPDLLTIQDEPKE